MAGYTDEYRKQHEARVKAAEDEKKELKRANDAARKRYLDGLEAERQKKRDEHEARIEERLAPTKARAQREWLYDHPEMTADDFDERAWPLLKENILEDERAYLVDNEVTAQLQRRRAI